MRLKIAFWFFKIAEIPSVDKTAKKPKEVAPKNKKKTPLNIRVKTYDDVIELLHSIKQLLICFKRLLKHIVIKNTNMKLVVVGNDAADTAIKYGTVCAAVYPITSLLAECFTFKPDSINVSAGFTEKEFQFYLKSDFSIRIIFILVFAKALITEYISLKKGRAKK